MIQPAQYTAERLASLRRTKNRATRLAWGAGALALVAGAVVVLAALDDRWLLSPAVREGGAGLLALLLLLAVSRLWQLGRQSGDDKAMALELERRRPELGCVVSTAAEYLEGKRTAAQPYEPELVEALQAAAAGKMHTVAVPWYRGKMAAALGVLALALGALALFVWSAPAGGVAVERVAWPWAKVAYTHVEVRPGNTEIAIGHSLNVLATFQGRMPRDARLRWRAAQADYWQTTPLSLATNGSCTNLIANITNAVQYQVVGGDAVSPVFAIQTFNPPELKSLTTRVEFPAYTKHPPLEQTSPDLRVVRGTRLAFHVAASGELARVKMIFTNEPPLELTQDADHRWIASLTARASSDYRIELTDRNGRTGGNETPFHLVVVPDEPPQVDVVDPQADVRADPTNTVPLRITASDDFAVAGIKVVYNKLGGPEEALVCNVTNLNEPEASAMANLDLAPLHLQPYELVAYHAEARDNNTLDGPGLGKSPVYFIEFTTNSELTSGSSGQGQGQKINLLELEKQIIAATTAVPEEKLGEKLPEVATVQRQTREFADTFRQSSPILAAAPPEARQEFDVAMVSMAGAVTSLDQVQRPPSLAAEEDALLHLYQAVRLFPELKPCMCNCSGIKIVAQAIEKRKQADQDKQKQELPKLIAQAKKVAAAQAQLNGLYRRSAEAAKPGLAGAGAPPPTADPDAKDSPNAGNDKTNAPAANPSAEQVWLAEQASAMAAKLRELAGSNSRISSRHAEHMNEVAGKMRKAGEQAVASHSEIAESTGRAAEGQLEEIVGALEILANDQPHASESAAEEYPREYGDKIADYLRALSYQK